MATGYNDQHPPRQKKEGRDEVFSFFFARFSKGRRGDIPHRKNAEGEEVGKGKESYIWFLMSRLGGASYRPI